MNTVVYKIKADAKNKTNLMDEEKVISQNNNFIKIELKSDNDFMIIQRLLNFGSDLVYIKNKDIEEKYISKLSAIKEIYKGE